MGAVTGHGVRALPGSGRVGWAWGGRVGWAGAGNRSKSPMCGLEFGMAWHHVISCYWYDLRGLMREGESAMSEMEQQVRGWWARVIAWLRGGQRADATHRAKAALADLRDSETGRKAEAAIRDLRQGEVGRKAEAAIRDLRGGRAGGEG